MMADKHTVYQGENGSVKKGDARWWASLIFPARLRKQRNKARQDLLRESWSGEKAKG
jgi:hypothetical protein